MQRKQYVGRFCVLLFLVIDMANVNALSLVSCDNPLEHEVCNLTCTTTDHLLNVAFSEVSDPSIIAQCDFDLGCSGTNQFNISQPDSVTTVLSFIHSRNYSSTWKCSYGLTPTSVLVPWATYPLTVSTTLTSNTTVDTNIEGNVTLECLYSEQPPNVTLQYEDANGNNDAISAETFQCDATGNHCADVKFTTYGCPVVVKEETGIDHSDTYSIKLKIKVSHVQTEDVHTIVTGITFKRPGGTSTSTKKYELALAILSVCLLAAFFIVVAVRFYTWSTGNKSGNCFLRFCLFIEEKLFDCCGSIFRHKNWVLGFMYLVLYGVIVGVIVLIVVYYGSSKFQEGLVIGVGFVIVLVLSCLCLVVVRISMKLVNNGASRSPSFIQNGTVTPQNMGKSQKKETFDKRQQPDGDEGPQSTPKDPDARHLTTGRPLPRRPDIASPQTGSFDSVNSPRPNGLAPIENPNILPSIDTLDEQKTDKKPKDKKKKKKKKKKDEEQDNPADVQDNNVLT